AKLVQPYRAALRCMHELWSDGAQGRNRSCVLGYCICCYNSSALSQVPTPMPTNSPSRRDEVWWSLHGAIVRRRHRQTTRATADKPRLTPGVEDAVGVIVHCLGFSSRIPRAVNTARLVTRVYGGAVPMKWLEHAVARGIN